jgi:Protein of unknown function (DUF4058)
MPLLDHFHPPLSDRRHWESFHGTWATEIARHLNHGQLPAGYFAEPHVKLSVQVEADVATLAEDGRARGADDIGGVATAVWAPPRPLLTASLDWADLDLFEVEVYREEGGLRLVAAVELISPSNKDRPTHRRAFAVKCGSYLEQGVAVVVVDAVTERKANLHTELLDLLELPPEVRGQPLADLYAVAYRTITSANRCRLEAWPESLALAAPLPTLPLWIDIDRALPLNLEQSYLAACDTLRIRR